MCGLVLLGTCTGFLMESVYNSCPWTAGKEFLVGESGAVVPFLTGAASDAWRPQWMGSGEGE